MEVVVLMCYIFVVGACLGSFINVLALRVVNEKPLWTGRSQCDHCGHIVAWYDLFPVLSYIILRGKCRYCHQPIGVRHFVVEVVDGILSVLIFMNMGYTFDAVMSFIVLQILILISLIDWDVMIIPDELVVILAIIVGIDTLFLSHVNLMTYILGMVSVSGIMFLINKLVQESFGGGDIKLMLVCGFWLGLKLTLLSGFIAVVSAGVYAMYLLIRKRIDKGGYIAFGPFLCIGVYFSLLYGDLLLNWYFQLF